MGELPIVWFNFHSKLIKLPLSLILELIVKELDLKVIYKFQRKSLWSIAGVHSHSVFFLCLKDNTFKKTFRKRVRIFVQRVSKGMKIC